MSASDPAKDAEAAAVALEAEIARRTNEQQALIDARTAAIVRRAQGATEPELAEEISRLGREIATLESEIAGDVEAVRQVREAVPALAKREAAAVAEATMAKAEKNAAAVRKAAKAVDEAADALGRTYRELKQACATLLAEADAAVRATDGFDMLAHHAGNLPTVIQLRLSHWSVMPAGSYAVDKSAPPRSVKEEMDRAIYGLLPVQGRPRKSSEN